MGWREASILSNPLRVKILGAISARPATTGDLATSTGAPLAAIGYHIRVLCRTGCIRSVESGDDSGRFFEAGR